MEHVWAVVFSVFTLMEYFSFYYVIYGKRLQITRKRSMGLAAVLLSLTSICLFWQEQMFDFQIGMVFLASFLVAFCLMCLLWRM